MPRVKIEAVQDVSLAVPQGLDEALRWFYVELAGLMEVGDPIPGALHFRSDRIDLRCRATTALDVDPVPVRLIVRVHSLDDIARRLDDRRVKYSRYAGLSYTDRALTAPDPAGYRIEFRRRWPDWPF
jgi:hypothetical protein